MERTLEISTLWHRTWAYRRPIVILVLSATVITAVVAFLTPPWYRATGTLLPPGEEETGFGIARLLKGMTGVPGAKIPTQATPADIFLAVLESRRLSREMVDYFDLKKRYQKKFMEDAVKELKGHVKFKLNDSGTIDIAVEDRDPKVAAAMVNAYIELLDRFNRDVRMTKGRRTRLFVEQRLDQTKRDLANAEQLLTDYQSKNKAVVLSPEASSAIEAAARMYAQRTALQVKLGVIQGYSKGTTAEAEQIVDQLAQLDRQLVKLPETGLELARLLRDVKTQEQVYVLLTEQYEEARIDEARDVVTVEVLDPGTPPEHKVRPHRLVMIVISMALSLAVGVAYALFQQDEGSEAFIASAASG